MILDSFKLNGKVAIVTGCNTGLGQGMAVALAEAGAHVIGINMSESTETANLIHQNGGKFDSIQIDLSKEKAHDEVMDKVLAISSNVHILVNNAGIIRREDSVNFTETDWDDVMNLNSKVVFFLSQKFVNQCIKQSTGGKIINIASMLSFQGGIRVPSYTASKSAVLGLTRAMANEWATYNINVNAIAPGYMETNNTAPLLADKARTDAITARIPAGVWGKPKDLMGAVVFLASSASDYVHGATIPVDGGWLAR